MKKITLGGRGLHCLPKFSLEMKLTAFFLIVSLFQIQANTYSQNAEVTLNMDRVTIEDVFVEIEAKTDYKFLYNINDINLKRIVSVNVYKTPLSKVLTELFHNTNVAYMAVDHQIVLRTAPLKRMVPATEIASIQQTITGNVMDKNGLPIFGVNVLIKGTQAGVTTDFDGNYAIKAVKGEVLVFSYIGMKTVEVAIENETQINVALKEEASALEEVVLVGYGQTRKKDLTGSVSTISAKEFEGLAMASVDNAMVGKASGVQIIKADGSPGGAVRIKIRGGTSLLGGNDPLYVIDGVPVTVTSNSYVNDDINIVSPIEAEGSGEDFGNTVSGAFSRGVNSLAGLNINDIASIDILKDASATAIYGSKAANGVVIITTKSGSYNQKLSINLNHYTSFSNPLTQKVMNAQQFRGFNTVSAQNLRNLLNDGIDRPYLSSNDNADMILDDPNAFFGTANTNWLDLVTRVAKTQNTDLSISGGGKDSRYYTSLSYMDQDGTIINTGFKRLAFISKLDNSFSDRFRISTKVGLSFTENELTNGVYGQALVARPDLPIYDDSGNFSVLDRNYTGVQNPIAVSKITNEAKTFNLNGYLSAEYDLLEDLKFKSTFSADMSMYRQKRYVPSFVDVGGFYGRESSNGGRGSNALNESLRTIFENYFTWNKTFNDTNKLNMVVGTAWEKFDSEFTSASGQGYPDDFILNNLGSAANATQIDGGKGANSLLSFYGRANYNYADKYLLTFTGRADASSKFSPENRWAIFPSGAIAWRVSEENFMKDSQWLDELKFRASMGKVGTQNIGDHLYRTLYDPADYAGSSAIVPTTLGNNDLKWEETLQKDIAVDYALFNNRISGTFGYYNKNTEGQLLNITVAPSSGFPSLVTNIATVTNEGWEIDFNADIIRSKNFKWNASLNLSKNKSLVTHINGGPFSDPFDREALSLGTSIVKEGEPLGLLYGYVTNGIIRNVQDLEDYRNEVINDIGGFWGDYILSYVTIGSVKYAIDEGDLKQDIIGNANPDFYGGFSNTFSYKNFSLFTLFNFSYGNELIWQRDVLNRQVDSYSVRNLGVEALNYYSATNTGTDRPIPIHDAFNFLTNDNVFDASFIKLKQVTLNYSFSKQLLEKINLNNASVYLSASNLFTITNYPGLDPEVSDDPKSIIGGGRDTDNYPSSKTITFGVKIGL